MPSCASRSTRWPTAASTTSWAAASTATATDAARGSCRTSSRCSTTTPSSRGSTSTPGRRPATTRYREVATGTLDYMIRELTTDDGAFAASQDADTEGVEGLTFVWRAAEIREVLGDDAEPFMAAYGVDRGGQLGGRARSCRGSGRRSTRRRRRARTPRSRRGLAESRAQAARAPVDPAAAGPRRQGARGLERARDRRVRRRGATARRDDPDAPTVPRRRRSRRPRRSSPACSPPTARSRDRGRTAGRRGQGVLEDYADLADGLLALYEATFDERWFTTARALDGPGARAVRRPGRRVLRHGRRPRAAGDPTRRTSRTTRSRRARRWRRSVLLRLAAWTGEGRYRDAAERALRTVVGVRRPLSDRLRPVAVGDGLRARADVVEVAIVGRAGRRRDARRCSAGRGRRGFRPHQVVAVSAGSGRRASSRCLPTGSPSTADRPPTSVAASCAACRSPTPTHCARTAGATPADVGRDRAVESSTGGDRRPDAPRTGTARRSCWRAAGVHGVRARRPRLPRRPGRPGRRAIRASSPAPCVSPEDGGIGARRGPAADRRRIAAYIAAIRESFEEAGVLLADVGAGVGAGGRSGGRARPWSAGEIGVPGAGRHSST